MSELGSDDDSSFLVDLIDLVVQLCECCSSGDNSDATKIQYPCKHPRRILERDDLYPPYAMKNVCVDCKKMFESEQKGEDTFVPTFIMA